MSIEQIGPSGKSSGGLGAKDVLAGLQQLRSTGPVGTHVSLEWAVSAQFLGDMHALAYLTLRGDG
jgi:hypothetical protein